MSALPIPFRLVNQPPEVGSPEWQRQIASAKQLRRRIDKAARVAAFNGWTAAVLAALSMPLALFSRTTLVAVIVLGVNAYVEFTGKRMLRRLDERAPLVLACNQFALGAIIIAYAVWQLAVSGNVKNQFADEIAQNPELADILGQYDDVWRLAWQLVYGALIFCTILMQGGMGLYYLTRRRHLRRYVDETPDWVVTTLQAAS